MTLTTHSAGGIVPSTSFASMDINRPTPLDNATMISPPIHAAHPPLTMMVSPAERDRIDAMAVRSIELARARRHLNS